MATKGRHTVLEHVRNLVNSHQAGDVSDGQLLDLFCSRHDEAAFATLLHRHEQLVWNVCRFVLRHHQDAEDAFQATFLVLARKVASIRKTQSLGSWLHGVAYRVALRAKRDAARQHARDRQAKPMAQNHPIAEKAWEDLQAALTAEVERLPAKYKAPFVLCHLEGKSMAEAAQQLGWKTGTVSGRLVEARRLLEKGLARQGVALPAVLAAAALSQSTSSAAVPAVAAQAVVKAAAQIAAGQAPGAAVSAKAITLARGVLRSMTATELKFKAVLLLALSAALLGGGTWTYRLLAGGQASENPAVEKADTPRPVVAADEPERPTVPGLVAAHVGTTRYRLPAQGLLAALADGRRALIIQPNEHTPAWLVDLETGKTIRRYKGLPPANAARGLLLAAGNRAVYCDNSEAVCVLDLDTGKIVRCGEGVVKGVSSACRLVVSGDGRRVAVATGSVWGDTKKASQMLVCDVVAGKVVADLRIDGVDVRGVALSADGERVVILALGIQPPPGPDGKPVKRTDLVEVREVASGKAVARMDGVVDGSSLPACFSPDGKYLAAVIWPGVQVWDTVSGRPVWKDEHVPYVKDLRFAPDGGRLCAATIFGEVRAWNAATGKDLATHRLPARGAARSEVTGYREDTAEGTQLVFPADGRWLAVGWRGLALSAWDVKASTLLTPSVGFTWPVAAVRFSADGREVLAATDSLAVARADARTGRLIASVPLWLAEDERPDPVLAPPGSPSGVALSPDGRYLAFPTRSRKLALAEVGTGRVLWTAPLSNRSGISFQVAPVFSPDGSRVSAGGLFEPIGNGRTYPPLRAWETATGTPVRKWEPEAGRRAAVTFSPDAKKVVVVTGDAFQPNNQLGAWELPSRRVLVAVTAGFGHWLAIGPDNRTLVVTEENRIVGRDLLSGHVTRSLDFLPRRQEGSFEVGRRQLGPFDQVGPFLTCPFTFSPDGRLFAVGCMSPESNGVPQIRVYEWAGFGERFRLAGHAGRVRCLAFSPDGKFLASGSDDTTVMIWDLGRMWQAPRGKAPRSGADLWALLSSPVAGPAWDALRELAARPEVALPLLQERLKPAVPLDLTEADIPDLIKRLGSESFPERERASRDLRRLGTRAIPYLQKTMANPPSLEVGRRAEALLKDVGRPDPALARHSRSVELLEHLASPAARRVLRALAGGAPGQALTEQAQAALRRLPPDPSSRRGGD
jgi:RNA polymerase sigma factor (sigma-70 family)